MPSPSAPRPPSRFASYSARSYGSGPLAYALNLSFELKNESSYLSLTAVSDIRNGAVCPACATGDDSDDDLTQEQLYELLRAEARAETAATGTRHATSTRNETQVQGGPQATTRALAPKASTRRSSSNSAASSLRKRCSHAPPTTLDEGVVLADSLAWQV